MLPTVFKITANTLLSDANIGATDFKEHFPFVNTNMEWATLVPIIRQANEKYILPFLGSEFYNTLVSLPDSELLPTQQEAIILLKDALAHYTVLDAYRKGLSILGDMGVMQNAPDNGANPAPIAAYKIQILALTEDADRHLDLLTQFCELHFEEFKTSKEYKKAVAPFFNTTIIFNDYFNIFNSRRTFIGWLPILRQTAKRHVLPLLGVKLYKELYFYAQENEADKPLLNELLESVRHLVAKQTAADATQIMHLIASDSGFKTLSINEGVNTQKAAVDNNNAQLKRLQHRCQDDAQTEKANIRAFLFKHKELFLETPFAQKITLPQPNIITPPDGIGAVGFF